MKKYLKLLAIVLILICLCISLSGCFDMDSELVTMSGHSSTVFDSINVTAPDGFFMSSYDKVKIDDHNLDLIIHLTNETVSDLDDWK